MLNLIRGSLLEIIYLIIFSMLGMAVLPDGLNIKADNKTRKISFMLSPIIGFAAWLGISLCAGMFVYNRVMLVILIIFVAVIIIYRRNRLFFVTDKAMWIYIFFTVLVSAFMIYCVLPREVNGGIFFTCECFDNAGHVALANSIAANGLPPINPFLTYNGELLPAYYHFGLSAFVAQPVILAGADTIIVNAMTSGLAIAFLMLLCAAMAVKFLDGKIFYVFTFLLIMIGTPEDILTAILPKALQQVLYPQAGFIGFFSMFSEIAYSEHAYLAAVIMVTVLYMYIHMLSSDDKKESVHTALLVGAMSSSAFYLSVYCGIYASVLLALSVIILYISQKQLRSDVNRTFLQHILMVAVLVFLIIVYVFFLLKRTQSGDSGLALGVLPAYGVENIWQTVGAFLDFYLFLLPSNFGLVIIFAYILIFFPKLFPDNRFFEISRVWAAIQLLSIFVIHSSAMTNDYGWRTTDITYTIAIICGAILLKNLFIKLYDKATKYGYIMLGACIVLCVLNCSTLIISATPQIAPSGVETNVAFKNSLPGWSAIRKYTDKNDIVMCNPMAFYDVGMIDESADYNTINYFSAYYSDRYTAISDKLTPVTSFRGPQTDEEIEELYDRMVDIFAGDPDSSDISFLADKQNVKAILVVPSDGLWDDAGALYDRYELTEEDEYYKVYVRY